MFHTNWHQTLVCPQKGQSCDSPHETEGRGILELKILLPANNTLFSFYFNMHTLKHYCNKLKATTLHATIKSSPFISIYRKIAKLMWPCHCKPWPEEFKRGVLHFGPRVMKRKLEPSAAVSSSVLCARVMSWKWDWNVASKLYQNTGNYVFFYQMLQHSAPVHQASMLMNPEYHKGAFFSSVWYCTCL